MIRLSQTRIRVRVLGYYTGNWKENESLGFLPESSHEGNEEGIDADSEDSVEDTRRSALA